MHDKVLERSGGGGALQVLVKLGADASGVGLRQGRLRHRGALVPSQQRGYARAEVLKRVRSKERVVERQSLLFGEVLPLRRRIHDRTVDPSLIETAVLLTRAPRLRRSAPRP